LIPLAQNKGDAPSRADQKMDQHLCPEAYSLALEGKNDMEVLLLVLIIRKKKKRSIFVLEYLGASFSTNHSKKRKKIGFWPGVHNTSSEKLGT